MNCVKRTFVFFFSLLTTHYPLLVLLLLITQSSLAQKGSNCPEDLVPKYGDNKMWGYANLFGQWVINPSYTKVSPYVENKAVVMKGLSYGVIDCEGNVILHAQYEKLTNFRYGKIWARKNGMWGLLNEKGIAILQHQYSEINPIAFTELSWVKKDNVWGLLDEAKGVFLCKPQFKIAQVMSENATLVQLNEPTFGVVNHVKCEYLLPHTLSKVKKVAPHTIIFLQEGKWGVFNEWGKVVSNAEYDSIAPLKTVFNSESNSDELLLLTLKNNLYGLININGKTVSAPQFEEIAPFSGGFFRIKQKGKYGFVNRLGKMYIKAVYEEAGHFYNGQAIVKKNGKYGVIDFKNQWIMPAQFAQLERNPAYKYYAAKETDKFYLYGMNGKKISDKAFEGINVADSLNITRVQQEGKTRFFNIETKNFSFEGSYEKAEPFNLGFASVSNAGKWGLIDRSGKVIVPLNFDKIEYDWFGIKMIFRTMTNSKFGIIDQKGKVILNNDYELIATAAPNFLKAKKEGKYGVLKNDGTIVTEFVYEFMSNEMESPGVAEWPAIVVKKEKFGLLNEKGEEVYAPKAVKIEYLGEGYYAVKEKKTFGLMNSKASNEYDPKYDAIRGFGDGLAAVQKGGKWGYITKSGEEKIKPQFEDAGAFIQYMAPVKMNGLWGIVDVNGNFMVKAEYEKYLTLPDGTRKLYKAGQEFTLLKGGKLK